jgi:uncharacterized membrane protein (DUF485 family)
MAEPQETPAHTPANSPAPVDYAAAPVHDDHHAPTVARNARIGLWLFGVYLLLYGGFMVLNAFYPQRMARPALAGVNLAVTYGLVLIVGAFVLALLYMFLVRGRAGDAVGDGNGSDGGTGAGTRGGR